MATLGWPGRAATNHGKSRLVSLSVHPAATPAHGLLKGCQRSTGLHLPAHEPKVSARHSPQRRAFNHPPQAWLVFQTLAPTGVLRGVSSARWLFAQVGVFYSLLRVWVTFTPLRHKDDEQTFTAHTQNVLHQREQGGAKTGGDGTVRLQRT